MEQNDIKHEHHLIEKNQISEKTHKNMRTRILSAIVLLFICLPIAFVGGWLFFAFIAILAGIAIFEVIKVPKQKQIPILLFVALYIMTFFFIYSPFIQNCVAGPKNQFFVDNLAKFGSSYFLSYGFASQAGQASFLISTFVVGLSFVFLFLVTISDETFTIKDVFYYFGISIILGLGFQSFYYLRYLPFEITPEKMYDGGVNQYLNSSLLFMYVVIGTMITDIGAYFVGVLFGKHQMNPRVSPKKTWEGFAGGIIISFVVSVTFAFTLSACGIDILPGYLDIPHWHNVVILSILMPVIGNLGDLAFSAIKRDYNIKDYGNIIPGHGGVLDRIDSLLFTTMIVSISIMVIGSFLG